MLRRRDLLRSGALSASALALGPSFWRGALAQSAAVPGVGPYGPLGAADANGLALPSGFKSRVIAEFGTPVASTGYTWPVFPDGSATYAQRDGGYVLVVNSEAPSGQGGASSISFDKTGAITGARRILAGTSSNCGGGATPWGTWLSCEEVDDPGGLVWECDPLGVAAAVARPALGRFKHEAAAVDPDGRRVYLSEDIGDSAFYRFTPRAYPDLSAGILEIAMAAGAGGVRWVPVPDPTSAATPARKQVPGYLQFKRGEGIFYDTGTVYVATTTDDRIYAYDVATERIDVLYDGKTLKDAPLHEVDNITVHPPSGDLFVCEDADNFEIGLITADREVAPFLRMENPLITGSGEASSETTGVTFDPAGGRLYFSSQRAHGGGMTFEVSGPFRTLTPRRPPRVVAPAATQAPALRLLRVRAPQRIALATLRKQGLLARLTVDRAGTYVARLVVGGRTIARASRRIDAGGSARLRLRARPDALRNARGRKIAATLVVTQGRRRLTQPVVLTRGR